MPAPTRPQIESPVTASRRRVRWDVGAGLTELTTGTSSRVIWDGCRVRVETTGGSSGLAFGDETRCTADVELYDSGGALFASAWYYAPIVIEATYEGADWQPVFRGVVTGAEHAGYTTTLRCGGADEILKVTPVRTVVSQRRLIATRTTVTSAENPDTNPGQQGMLNELFWRAGGRPLDQQGSYPLAPFFYACDDAPLIVEYAWIDGEHVWPEALRLARAAGGQILVDTSGSVRYASPLALAGSGTAVHLTTNPLTPPPANRPATIAARMSTDSALSAVRCAFVARRAYAGAQIYEDRAPKLLRAGETKEYRIEPQWPILSWQRITAQASYPDGEPVMFTESQGLVVLERTARLARIQITNGHPTAPLVVNPILATGEALGPGVEGSARVEGPAVGPIAIERALDESPYIQSYTGAERLCTMVGDFYARPRRMWQLDGLAYDPAIQAGARCALTHEPDGIAALPVRVVSLDVQVASGRMGALIVDVSDIPVADDFFIIGTSYSDGQTKRLGY